MQVWKRGTSHSGSLTFQRSLAGIAIAFSKYSHIVDHIFCHAGKRRRGIKKDPPQNDMSAKRPNLLFQFQLFHLHGEAFTEFLFFNQNPSHHAWSLSTHYPMKIIILPFEVDYGFPNIEHARIFCQEYLREEFYFSKKILTSALCKSLLIMRYISQSPTQDPGNVRFTG